MTSGKPRKRDFADMREFMKAAAEWATANMSEWPWGGPKDEDDEFYFVVLQRDDIVEKCAVVAETLHGVDEGDIPQYVFAGHRIAKAIRDLKLRGS